MNPFTVLTPFAPLIVFVGECEQRINDVRARIPRQQDLIRTRRSEKQRLEEEARRLRDGIERLKMIGVRVAELEGKKQKAVENEDYESAHVLKLDIDKLRQSCVCECCPPSKDATFPPP